MIVTPTFKIVIAFQVHPRSPITVESSTANFHRPSEPDFAHASIRTFIELLRARALWGPSKWVLSISKPVSGSPARAQVAVTK